VGKAVVKNSYVRGCGRPSFKLGGINYRVRLEDLWHCRELPGGAAGAEGYGWSGRIEQDGAWVVGNGKYYSTLWV
jgi:hypothetical protein